MKNRSFAIVGGDMRSYELAKLLMKKGHKINLYGFNKLRLDNKIKEEESISSAIKDVDVVVLPIPITRDKININAPYSQREIAIEEVFKNMKKSQILIGGKAKDCIKLKEHHKIEIIDLMDREEMAVLNAIPTAEGALQIALKETPKTVHGSDSMVLGFGRIGKIMAKMLAGIGSNVYVLARKHSDIAWIKAYGYSPIYIFDLKEKLASIDLIFNTIPKTILNKELLKLVDEKALIIDLASTPGGLDYNEADKMNIKVIHALGLPGKVAPVSSAKFILETIYNIIEEMGG